MKRFISNLFFLSLLFFFSATMVTAPAYGQSDPEGKEVLQDDQTPVKTPANTVQPAPKREVTAPAQPAVPDPSEPVEDPTTFAVIWAWVTKNWIATVFGVLSIIEIIVGVTPTEKDNAWFKWLRDLIYSILPNKKAGGGTHAKA